MINFSVPTNYTDNQLFELDKLNKESSNGRKIKELYDSMLGAPIGTIRPAVTLPQINEAELLDYITKAKKYNFEFDYIMNGTVSDGIEYSDEGKQQIIDFVGKLLNAGVKRITVSIPYLIRFIKHYYPNINITASICAEIESVQRAKDFEAIGADMIMPAKDLNRDFDTLEKIVRNTALDVKVLCTTPCIYKCSDLYYHMNLSAVRDNRLASSFVKKGEFLSYTTARCQRRKLEKLEEYIKSPWIRPEDVNVYEKIGIQNFKLDGRDKKEEYNINVAKAYMQGDYKGNLLYLMQWFYPKDREELEREKNEEFWRLGVYVDNKKLDGFISKFADKKISCASGCGNCRYCEGWAKKVVEIQQENVAEYLALLSKTEEDNFAIGAQP